MKAFLILGIFVEIRVDYGRCFIVDKAFFINLELLILLLQLLNIESDYLLNPDLFLQMGLLEERFESGPINK